LTQLVCAGSQLHGICAVGIMAGRAAQSAIDQGEVAGHFHRDDINRVFTVTGSLKMAVDTEHGQFTRQLGILSGRCLAQVADIALVVGGE